MPFDRMPTELIKKVFEEYMSDDAMLDGPKGRLVSTVRLGLINRRIRAIALSELAIWRTIYLHWPADVVEEYFRRAQDSDISVYLDTFQGANSKEAAQANRARWGNVLRSKMGGIVHLDACIRSAACGEALSDAFETPAPHLQTLRMALGNFKFCHDRLFSLAAPKLQAASFDSRLIWNLVPFTSLSTVTIHICRDNSRKTLAMLQSMPQAKDITLVGSITNTDVPAPRQLHSVVFKSCHRFEVKNMVSFSVRRLMSTIRLPLLRTLEMQEYVTTEDDLGLVPTAVPEALASVPGPWIAPTSLFVQLYPERIIMRTEGEPAVHYVSDWRRLDSVPLGDRRILDTASAMISSLSTHSGMRPARLCIHNSIRGPMDAAALLHTLPPTLLRAMNAMILFIRVFQSYPEVDTLELSGHIEQPLFAVRGGTLLHLSHLIIRNLAVGVTVPMYIIDQIRLSRDLELHIA